MICQACGHEGPCTAVAGPQGAYWYCNDRDACRERSKLRYIRGFNKQTKETNEMTLPQHSRFNWDAPEFRTSDFWKWEKPGDTVSGVITEIGTHTFEPRQMPDGTTTAAKTVPVITVQASDGTTTEVTCSNADLLEQIRGLSPQVGDSIRMEYLREIPTSFGGKKKIFAVKHKPAAAPTAPAEAPAQEAAWDGGDAPF